MQTSKSGEAIILSQDDVDQLAQGLADLMDLMWTMMARRRVILTPPTQTKPASLASQRKRQRREEPTLLDDIF